MRYSITQKGDSRSFPKGDAFLQQRQRGRRCRDLSQGTASWPTTARPRSSLSSDTECLGVHTGQQSGEEGSNVLGFARYRNGDDPPSKLVELVRQPRTKDSAIAAARTVFEAAGLTVVVCSDQPGRIIDRLVRPKYNAALRFLDEGLATAKDMDLTCRLGLGYPDGPIERVERGGLTHHHDVTRALFDAFGSAAYAPAPRAIVAKQREAKS